MTYPAYENELQAWVRGCVTRFDVAAPTPPAETPVAHTVQVVWADQDAPRPKPPYLSLQVISTRGLGRPERVTQTSEGASGVEAALAQRREGILEVQAYGPNHDALMSAVELSIRDSERMDTLRAEGVAVESHGIRRRIGLASSRVTETRSVTEFVFRYVELQTVAVAGAVGTVETSFQAITRTQSGQQRGGPGPLITPPPTNTNTGAPFDFEITVPTEED